MTSIDLRTAFLLYAAIFRVAVIATGTISIVLGYRLFSHGLSMHAPSAHARGDVEAKFGTAAITLHNTAPGTVFALFGAALIIAMMVQGTPELTETTSKNASAAAPSAESRVELRGEDPLTLTERGLAAERRRDPDAAVRAYQQALAAMTTPMNNLAWLYNERGEHDQALPLARAAVQLHSDNAAYRDTLATILLTSGQPQEGVTVMREAARLDPRYQAKLKQLETGNRGR